MPRGAARRVPARQNGEMPDRAVVTRGQIGTTSEYFLVEALDTPEDGRQDAPTQGDAHASYGELRLLRDVERPPDRPRCAAASRAPRWARAPFFDEDLEP